nr:ribose-phosphate pyrophosphokinase 1-like [Tanacetum cinerariifolium]
MVSVMLAGCSRVVGLAGRFDTAEVVVAATVVVAAAVVKLEVVHWIPRITLLMLLAAKGFETQGREYIVAELTTNLIIATGAYRVLACDLHSGRSMGYFDIPVDYVYCQPVILDYLASKLICSSDLVVVSHDVGGVARARAFTKNLSDAPMAIVDKMRHGHNVADVMNLIGDVKGKVALMVDDVGILDFMIQKSNIMKQKDQSRHCKTLQAG